MTSKNDVLTYFRQKSGCGVPCRTPPSAQFYCYYRSPEAGRSPARQWSAVRCGASQKFHSVFGRGPRRVWGERALSWARSLSLYNWTAGAAPIWEFSKTGGLYSAVTHHTRYSLRRPGSFNLESSVLSPPPQFSPRPCPRRWPYRETEVGCAHNCVQNKIRFVYSALGGPVGNVVFHETDTS